MIALRPYHFIEMSEYIEATDSVLRLAIRQCRLRREGENGKDYR